MDRLFRRKVMKYAISGAQSVGKTTVIEALQKELPKFNYLTYITRAIRDRGFLINEAGTDETQLEILKEHILRAEIDNTVLDRCILDGMVYTQYLYEREMVTLDTVKEFNKVIVDTFKKYDKVFYITPEFNISYDGQRSTDIGFRDRIVEIFDECIQMFKLDVVILTGTVQERVEQFINEIDYYNKKGN